MDISSGVEKEENKMTSSIIKLEGDMKYFTEIESLHKHKLTEKYIAGMIDGDGTITITRDTHGRASGYNGNIILSLDQCDPSVILLLYTKYGGTYELKQVGSKQNSRNRHRWVMSGPRAIQMIDAIFPHLILKKKRADLAKRYWELKNSNETTHAEIDAIFKENKKLQELDQLSFEEQDHSKLNDEYIAGLFDAEGCVDVYPHSFALTLVQKMRPEILHAIVKYYQMGYVYDNIYWRIGTMSDIRVIGNKMLPIVIVKHAQLEKALELLQIKKEHHNMDDFDVIKQLKHIEYSFSPELMNYVKGLAQQKNLENHKKRDISISKETRQLMSNKKKGPNHPNYGKTRPKTMAQKMSKTLTEKSRAEYYRKKILAEFEEEERPSFETVAKKYGVSRNKISKMVNGVHLAPSDRSLTLKDAEEARKHDELGLLLESLGYPTGRIKTMLAKRTWTVPEFVRIRSYIHSHPEHKNQYKLMERNSVDFFGKQFTSSTIKGIAQGTTFIFDFETQNLTPEEIEVAAPIWNSTMFLARNIKNTPQASSS